MANIYSPSSFGVFVPQISQSQIQANTNPKERQVLHFGSYANLISFQQKGYRRRWGKEMTVVV